MRPISKRQFRRSFDPEIKNQRKLNKRQTKQVKTLIRNKQELKYFFYNSAPATVTTTPFVDSAPFDIVQGTADTNRIGDGMQWAGSIDLRYHLNIADTSNNIRVVIFQWHGKDVPVAPDVFIIGPSGFPDIYSVYNHDTRDQYKILYDKNHQMVGNGTTGFVATTGSVQFHAVKIPLTRAKKDVQWVGGGVANGSNRLYMYTCSDSNALTHPTITFASKVFFRDS